MELLTVQEAADALRASTRSVQGWLASGKLRGVRLPGGGWRVPQAEVDRILMSGDQGGE